MVDEINVILCGQPFHLSKAKVMQCLIFRSMKDLFEKSSRPLFDNWDALFPTVAALCEQMPMEMAKVEDRFFEELRNLFWDIGEELPYDSNSIELKLHEDLMASDLFSKISAYRNRAYALMEQAEAELSDLQAPGLGGNSINVGFGLRGALESGIASAGADLLNYGIGRIFNGLAGKKYQAQAEDLWHGADTKREFVDIARAITDTGCTYAIENIAKQNGEDCILDVKHEDWNKRQPSYANLSQKDKIHICLSRLESSPVHFELYQELFTLSEGKDKGLIDYGDKVMGSNIGTNLRKKLGKQAYQTAVQMPETTLEEVNCKIAGIQNACQISEYDAENDQELQRLGLLRKKKETIELLHDRRSQLLHKLETMPPKLLLQQKDFYQTDGWSVFVQESYFVQNEYQNLPDTSVIQAFAERGNGVPILIRTEADMGENQEPVSLWTSWARKGNPYALLRLGLCRLRGYGIAKDTLRSKQLIQRAADAFYPPAMYFLQQIALGKYKPDFGYVSPEDKTKYASALELCELPQEAFVRYLSFGRK